MPGFDTFGGGVLVEGDRTTLLTGSEPAIGDGFLTNQASSQFALTILHSAMARLGSIRAQVGAFQNRVSTAISFQTDARLRAQESTSTLEDADYAEVASDQARAQIRQSLLDKVAPLQNVDAERAKRLIEMIG